MNISELSKLSGLSTPTIRYYEQIQLLPKPKRLSNGYRQYSEEDLKVALRDKRLNPETTRKGKNPTNVWEIGRLNGNSKERVGHPTQKPVAIIERFIKALSYPGATVLDFFAGSGTVGRVCINEGRNCLMCDSDNKSLEYFAKHISLME